MYNFIDRDDLVFPVGPQETDTVPPDQVVLTAPAPGATVTGTLTLTASASDNFGVVAVDFFEGETLHRDGHPAPVQRELEQPEWRERQPHADGPGP